MARISKHHFRNHPCAANPLEDTDGDGQSNYAEFIAGSNPPNPYSVFKIEGYQATRQTNGTQIVIRWASFAGSTYSARYFRIQAGYFSDEK